MKVTANPQEEPCCYSVREMKQKAEQCQRATTGDIEYGPVEPSTDLTTPRGQPPYSKHAAMNNAICQAAAGLGKGQTSGANGRQSYGAGAYGELKNWTEISATIDKSSDDIADEIPVLFAMRWIECNSPFKRLFHLNGIIFAKENKPVLFETVASPPYGIAPINSNFAQDMDPNLSHCFGAKCTDPFGSEIVKKSKRHCHVWLNE